jgi:hypothetical protein
MPRWALVAVLLALVPRPAHARERELRVVVRFAPQIPSADAARVASAIRGQLRDTATIDEASAGADASGATCIVDVDRSEAGIVLRFADAGADGSQN